MLDSVEDRAKSSQGKSAAGKSASRSSADTRLQIQLPEGVGQLDTRSEDTHPHPLALHDSLESWGGRTSWATYKQGDIYDIAQWYPRMCVYDDLHGWDTQPYLGSEFYLEYGHFDYFVTVPRTCWSTVRASW